MSNQQLKLLFIFLLQLTLVAIPQGLQAQLDPSIEWKEIRTDNAYWVFDAKQQELAEYYILQFERAKAEVFPLFKEGSRKPTIVLLDNTDQANGSATVTPHPTIRLFTVQPSYYSAIGEFRDYVHELLVHEYTHILNMEPVHGWILPMRWIFGSIARPNGILPRWYTEGLAVYTESKISKTGGRLNSQYLQGLARALTLEKKWDEYPLSDLNDGHLDWIGGSRAYLFGGILWDSIARDGGDEMIEKFNQSYSRRIPYFLDGVIETHLGRNYQEQLARAYKFWEMGAKKQIEKVSKAPQLPGKKITKDKKNTYSTPRISSDGLWMTYIQSGVKGFGDIFLTLRHPKKGFWGYKPKVVVKNSRGNHVAWHPASTGFVYEAIEKWDTYNAYYDLYFYDLKNKGKKVRLTRGLRGHSPCFSPLGKTLYFLANSKTSKRILAMDWLTQKTKVVYKAKVGEDLRHLSCAKKNLIYVVEHKRNSDPRLIRIDLTRKVKTNIYSKHPVHYAANTHKGLVITSPINGIDNLYLLDGERSSKPTAITNSLTRVVQGEIDPLDDSLYYSQLTADGPKIFHLKGAQWESFPDRLPKVDPIVDYGQPSEKETPPQNTSKLETRDFSPWRYLYPNSWIPNLFFVDGGTLFQAITGFGDPMGINSVSLVGQWDTLTKRAGGRISYVNNSTPVTLGAGLSDFYTWFYTTQTSLHFTNTSVFAGLPIPALDDTILVSRWIYSQLDRGSQVLVRQGPMVELSYSNGKAKSDDVAKSSGWNFQLGHREFMEDLGTEDYGETYAHVGTYWSSFTPGRSVFYLGINGSFSPDLTNSFFSTSTLAGPFFNPQITNTSFLQRGYPTGNFLAFDGIFNANAEFKFPIFSPFSGFTSPPFFFRNLTGNIVFDATTLDGAYANPQLNTFQRAQMGRWFTGYGLELEANTKMGFHVPVSFVLGLYYGQDQQASGGFTTFFNVRL